MRFFVRMMVAMSLLSPVPSQCAIVWSSCGTITSVSNYIANSNQFTITLSAAAIPTSCDAIGGVPGSVAFVIGQDDVTNTNITGLLATSLAASASGQRVMIAYDNSTSTCYGQIVAIGGYSAQCP